MPRKDDMLYSAGKIAKFFGVAKNRVALVYGGKLPAFKIGKEWKSASPTCRK